MRSWTIAFSLGVIVCGFVPQLPSLIIILGLLGLSTALQRWSRLRVLGAFGLGCCWLLLYARHSVEAQWPLALETEDVWVHGIVWSLPQQTDRALRFEFRIDKFCTSAVPARCDFATLPAVRKKVLISLYEPLPIVPGQRWQLQLRLRRPHGFANPGGFDYEVWLMQKQLRATGYVRQHPSNLLLAADSTQRRFTRLRAALLARLAEVGAGKLRYEHLIRALTIGDHYGISEAEWTLFRETGTVHLIVISGLHVALVALAIYQLGLWLGLRVPGLALRIPVPQLAAVLALCGAWCYSGLAGFSLPVQRAFVMAAVLLAGRILRRQTDALQALCLALALILLLDPLAPHNASFWLSYGAVAVLLLAARPSERSAAAQPLAWLLRAWLELRTQWVVCLGLLPVMLVFFQQVSVTAPLVNMLAIPWTGLLIVPLCLVAAALLWLWPWASAQLLQLADWLLHLFMEALRAWLTVSPLGLVQLPALSAWLQMIVGLLVLTALLAPRMWLRFTALPLLPLVFLSPRGGLAEGQLRVAVLDVGQGLAIVVSTAHQHLLYDAGPWFSTRFDAGSDVVVPYLRHQNIRRLDRVIISHADADHAGGMPGVAAAYPDALYLSSDPTIFAPALHSAACRRGQTWREDGVDFALLHPDTADYSRNNGSCVLEIRTAHITLLLPGDIERDVEHLLLQRGAVPNTTVLVAPHHGSRTSSSPAFVATAAPEVVIYASGYRNRFNHPVPEVVARYGLLGSRQLLTAASGAVTLDVSAEGTLSIREQRRSRRRFWSAPPP